MQTFLPYPSFVLSARVLDYRRLGKQRVEAKQILAILLGETPNSRWKNHPAVKMWKGYEYKLAHYGMCMCYEWIARGYKDNLFNYFFDHWIKAPNVMKISSPPWLGDNKFHKSHRCNLVRKKPEHYKQYWPRIRNDWPYEWPVK